MQEHVKRMILEHKDLKGKIARLEDYIYSRGVVEDDKVEYGNKCIQLRGYRMAFEALTCRLENNGIMWNGENGYAEVITKEHFKREEGNNPRPFDDQQNNNKS